MKKKEIKVDRRIIKTKKAIRYAFAALLSQKDINEITVKDVAATADINRKTFYNHYAGVYQIIDELEDEIVSAFNETIGEIDLKRDLKDPYAIFVKLTTVVNEDLDFYSRLLRIDSNSNLVSKIAIALKKYIIVSFTEQTNIDPLALDIMSEYICSGMLAVYRHWFNSSRDTSIENISEIVSIMTISGASGVLEQA